MSEPPAGDRPAAGQAAGLEVVHATAVAVGEDAVLLRGPPGAGKSDLALRLVTLAVWPGPRPLAIRLVADDRVQVWAAHGRLRVAAPASIAGRLEVRGLGIVEVPSIAEARLRLVVDLVERADVPRLPEPGQLVRLAGEAVERLALWPFEASAPAKALLALDLATGRRRRLEAIARR